MIELTMIERLHAAAKMCADAHQTSMDAADHLAKLEAKLSIEEILLSLSRDHAYVNLEYDDRYGWCVYTRKSWSAEDYVECGTEQDSPLLALRDKLEGE